MYVNINKNCMLFLSFVQVEGLQLLQPKKVEVKFFLPAQTTKIMSSVFYAFHFLKGDAIFCAKQTEKKKKKKMKYNVLMMIYFIYGLSF